MFAKQHGKETASTLTDDDFAEVREAYRAADRIHGKLREAEAAAGLHAVLYDPIGGGSRHRGNRSTVEKQAVKLSDLRRASLIADLQLLVTRLRLWIRIHELLPDSSKDRLILKLRHVDLLSWDEIADVMGFDSCDAARMHHGRLLKRLREMSKNKEDSTE